MYVCYFACSTCVCSPVRLSFLSVKSNLLTYQRRSDGVYIGIYSAWPEVTPKSVHLKFLWGIFSSFYEAEHQQADDDDDDDGVSRRTTYELRSHSLLPVDPRVTDKADSCNELSTAVITGKGSCICGLGCRDGLTCRTFPSSALLYCSNNTNFLKVLHPGEASFLPFRSVAS